jgi:hypothetical protein
MMMNELIKWDYEQSVMKMRPLIVKWRTMTIDMLTELWEAREVLSDRGSRSKLNDSQNWSSYLIDIDLPRSDIVGEGSE